MRSHINLAALAITALALGCGSDASTGGGSSALASLGDFCTKCEGCAFQAGFSEGFCSPFKDTTKSTFDRLGCTSKGDTTKLENQNVTVSQLQGWTCAEFDANE